MAVRYGPNAALRAANRNGFSHSPSRPLAHLGEVEAATRASSVACGGNLGEMLRALNAPEAFLGPRAGADGL